MVSRFLMVPEGVIVSSGCRIAGRVHPPPSKSLSQRVLNLGLLIGEPLEIGQPLIAEDTELFLAALETVGTDVHETADGLRLDRRQPKSRGQIWCGNNGTMLRFLTAALTCVSGAWKLDGTARLRQRPIGPLVEALVTLGARIRYEQTPGFAPITIEGGTLSGGSVELDARDSSQFVSALLMAAARAESEITVQVKNLVSAPYLRLTLDVLRDFGAEIDAPDSRKFRVRPSRLGLRRYEIEADFSSAAYPAAAAVLTGGRIRLEGLSRGSHQGDREFIDVLGRMGARIDWQPKALEIGVGKTLTSVDVDFSNLPDQVPTLAAVAPFASGTTVIRNVAHLRIKESDRLAAMACELRRLGAVIEELPDGLVIEGCWADRDRIPGNSVEVQTYGDHRIAMSLAICGLLRPGVTVGTPEVVAKSYPAFWNDLESLVQ